MFENRFSAKENPIIKKIAPSFNVPYQISENDSSTNITIENWEKWNARLEKCCRRKTKFSFLEISHMAYSEDWILLQ